MDHVQEIKARLPIEELVRQYCQLQKKGRNFVCVCPFHNDTHPSFLVSPDKGIAYCFACQSGGDIFSFYQKIEHVDFPQALKDLAERTGIQLPKDQRPVVDKDEKERARLCLEESLQFFRQQLALHQDIGSYLRARGVTDEEVAAFAIGYAPQGYTTTYDHLLKKGCSKNDILRAGMAVEKHLAEDRRYDRFHHRVMFPVHDAQGRLVAFAGRTMGNDDAKYMNSSDGILFHKSQVLFNMHRAKDAMRKTDSVVVVEGYFDVLAVRRVGVDHVVATCGTALTRDHARMLKRSVSTVILCFDSDAAGKAAAERAFLELAPEGLEVRLAFLPSKDAADLALSEPETLKTILREGSMPYLDWVLRELSSGDLRSAHGKRGAMERLRPLLQSLPTEVERAHYRAEAATALAMTEAEFERDMSSARNPTTKPQLTAPPSLFTAAELSLALLMLYPHAKEVLSEMIEPEEDFPRALFNAMKSISSDAERTPDILDLSPEHRERLKIVMLYCEQSGLTVWSELLAPKEIRKNIVAANKEQLRRKQKEITERLLEAKRAGKMADEQLLTTQYQHLLKLAKQSSL